MTVRPVTRLTAEFRPTVPAKLSILVKVTVTNMPAAPVLKLASPGVAIRKSPTWTEIMAESLAVPGEPLLVMVTA